MIEEIKFTLRARLSILFGTPIRINFSGFDKVSRRFDREGYLCFHTLTRLGEVKG